MSYSVHLSLEAVEDVLRITAASQAKAAIIQASQQLQDALANDPVSAGEHLSEGLYYVDRQPLRGFYTIDDNSMVVEIVSVKPI